MKNLFFLLLLVIATTSCVSSKIHEDLQDKYDTLRAENESLMSQLDGKGGSAEIRMTTLKRNLEKCTQEKTQLAMDLEASRNNYNRIKDSYDALEANSSENLTENLARNRTLLTQLEEKERLLNEKEAALVAEKKRLDDLKFQLADRSQRVEELESIIAAKEAQMKNLKKAISAALTNFEGNGLTVEQRDGKVYVLMENKLLFESGSWAVGTRGREAVVALGKVLAQNPEIAVLIEGHTDNVPYGGNGNIRDNWDLSTKRATSIVNILTENNSIEKDNLTAAGRGEFAPIAPNTSSEGKAKNRRIEVVLTPKLDEINKLLNDM